MRRELWRFRRVMQRDYGARGPVHDQISHVMQAGLSSTYQAQLAFVDTMLMRLEQGKEDHIAPSQLKQALFELTQNIKRDRSTILFTAYCMIFTGLASVHFGLDLADFNRTFFGIAILLWVPVLATVFLLIRKKALGNALLLHALLWTPVFASSTNLPVSLGATVCLLGVLLLDSSAARIFIGLFGCLIFFVLFLGPTPPLVLVFFLIVIVISLLKTLL